MKKADNKHMNPEMNALGSVWRFLKASLTDEARDFAAYSKMFAEAEETCGKNKNPLLEQLTRSAFKAVFVFLLSGNGTPSALPDLSETYNTVWSYFQTYYYIDYENEEDWNEVLMAARALPNLVLEKTCKPAFQILANMLVVGVVQYLTELSKARFEKRVA